MAWHWVGDEALSQPKMTQPTNGCNCHYAKKRPHRRLSIQESSWCQFCRYWRHRRLLERQHFSFVSCKLWWFVHVPAVPGCGMPPRMLHAFPVLPDDFQPNDEAEVTYNCSIGYYPVDSNMIWCDMNMWEGNITCLRKWFKKRQGITPDLWK